MFGGLITHIGQVVSVESCGSDMLLWIQSAIEDWVLGESVAVDGMCLTVTSFKGNCFSCLLSSHTLSLTIASNYQPQTVVNLERALCLNDRIGGHLLTGHIDAQSTIISCHSIDACWRMVFQCQDTKYLIQKGSVAINGVSLTVNAVNPQGFEVMIIPHTYAKTNLRYVSADHQVNIEYDQQLKVIINYIQKCGLYGK